MFEAYLPLRKWGGLGKGELPASYPQDISVNCIYVLGKRGGTCMNYTCNENGRISAAASVPNRISCIPPRAHQISPELQVLYISIYDIVCIVWYSMYIIYDIVCKVHCIYTFPWGLTIGLLGSPDGKTDDDKGVQQNKYSKTKIQIQDSFPPGWRTYNNIR